MTEGRGMTYGHETPTASGPECVERPLFTCGMVLSDADLTALVEWSRARLALQRFRTGWGVVCGLDVRCDTARSGWIRVMPGVAVGHDGQDIVVGESMAVDLTGCCVAENSCKAPAQAKQKEPAKQQGPAEQQTLDECGDVVVDLVLSAEDVPTGTDLAGRCDCGCGPTTEQTVVTRVCERARFHACRVPLPDVDPTAAAARRRQEAYSKCHAVVTRYVEAGLGKRSPDDVIDWLDKQRLDGPCGWWEKTCHALRASDDADLDGAVALALLDLVVDCRHQQVRRGCDSCAPCESCEGEDRLRLARVWLRRPTAADKTCRVTHIDAYPPHRRELGPCIAPVPPGSFDLTPFVWQRWQQVCARWRTIAGHKLVQKVKAPVSTENLLELLNRTDRISWDCDENPPVPVVVATACLGERVLGFAARTPATRTRRKAGP
ncbi:hypothetical protein G6045_09800 [Streptomyces sp. YC504]|uniref:Uncharacterized protein n=1 Tax=Streptomyces mesophilus TaxID=1775132 RepID=A0A6G4XGX0_9ACTN|nr:hypothetical protein [Streptomyces mesophilus]NGO75964.1 hypothetical protein [Streptomyces mesophilus]